VGECACPNFDLALLVLENDFLRLRHPVHLGNDDLGLDRVFKGLVQTEQLGQRAYILGVLLSVDAVVLQLHVFVQLVQGLLRALVGVGEGVLCLLLLLVKPLGDPVQPFDLLLEVVVLGLEDMDIVLRLLVALLEGNALVAVHVSLLGSSEELVIEVLDFDSHIFDLLFEPIILSG